MRLVLALLCAAASSGCVATLPSAVCEAPALVDVAVESGPLLNPDADGHALPTEVRLYTLRDASAFDTVAFEPVWESDADALGDAMLEVQSLTLYPGETAHGSVVPGAETHALVAMAIVRQPAGQTWRAVVDVSELPCGARSRVRLRVDEYRIERASITAGED